MNSHKKTAVVTGANAGFGFEIAKALAEKGLRVVLACRNTEKALAAKAKIENDVPNADIDFIELDLGSLTSVRNFAEIFGEKFGKINILVNNAGIMFVPRKVTEDGFEQIFQTNYLGHFLLTALLLPFFEDDNSSRIVCQSSVMYPVGKINFDDLQSVKYSVPKAYAQSKLAILMFSIELQRRLAERGKKILSVAAHPGVSVETNIVKNALLRKIAKPLIAFFSHSAKSGAMPAVAASTENNIKGGDFIGLDGFLHCKGKPKKQQISAKAQKQEIAEKLWKISENLVGEKWLF